jgi:hypothetical protein
MGGREDCLTRTPYGSQAALPETHQSYEIILIICQFRTEPECFPPPNNSMAQSHC